MPTAPVLTLCTLSTESVCTLLTSLLPPNAASDVPPYIRGLASRSTSVQNKYLRILYGNVIHQGKFLYIFHLTIYSLVFFVSCRHTVFSIAGGRQMGRLFARV
jgi:hypothetical protein